MTELFIYDQDSSLSGMFEVIIDCTPSIGAYCRHRKKDGTCKLKKVSVSMTIDGDNEQVLDSCLQFDPKYNTRW